MQKWLSELEFTKVGHSHTVNQPLAGRAVAIFGNGPSMTPAVASALEPYPHILTNNAFMLVHSPTLLVVLDRRWFEWHGAAVRAIGHTVITATVPGQPPAHRGRLINFAKSREDPLNMEPDILAGSNSGHAAILLALKMGATRVYLAGFDMGFVGGRAHWHTEHLVPASQANYEIRFRPELEKLSEFMASKSLLLASVTHTQAKIPTIALDDALKDLEHEAHSMDNPSLRATLPL